MRLQSYAIYSNQPNHPSPIFKKKVRLLQWGASMVRLLFGFFTKYFRNLLIPERSAITEYTIYSETGGEYLVQDPIFSKKVYATLPPRHDYAPHVTVSQSINIDSTFSPAFPGIPYRRSASINFSKPAISPACT